MRILNSRKSTGTGASLSTLELPVSCHLSGPFSYLFLQDATWSLKLKTKELKISAKRVGFLQFKVNCPCLFWQFSREFMFWNIWEMSCVFHYQKNPLFRGFFKTYTSSSQVIWRSRTDSDVTSWRVRSISVSLGRSFNVMFRFPNDNVLWRR
jgi:hypothetical protein